MRCLRCEERMEISESVFNRETGVMTYKYICTSCENRKIYLDEMWEKFKTPIDTVEKPNFESMSNGEINAMIWYFKYLEQEESDARWGSMVEELKNLEFKAPDNAPEDKLKRSQIYKKKNQNHPAFKR